MKVSRPIVRFRFYRIWLAIAGKEAWILKNNSEQAVRLVMHDKQTVVIAPNGGYLIFSSPKSEDLGDYLRKLVHLGAI